MEEEALTKEKLIEILARDEEEEERIHLNDFNLLIRALAQNVEVTIIKLACQAIDKVTIKNFLAISSYFFLNFNYKNNSFFYILFIFLFFFFLKLKKSCSKNSSWVKPSCTALSNLLANSSDRSVKVSCAQALNRICKLSNLENSSLSTVISH